jgi:hypothetical protein
MRRFYFDRQTDVSGTSGTGAVVEGVQFSDGSVYLRWMTHLSSWAHYRSIEECVEIHGHGGATNLVWVDEVPSDPKDYASENVRWFRQPNGRKWHRVSGRLFDDTDYDGDKPVTRELSLCGVVAWVGSMYMSTPGKVGGGACRSCTKELEKRDRPTG